MVISEGRDGKLRMKEIKGTCKKGMAHKGPPPT